jgi:hypothetical protein
MNNTQTSLESWVPSKIFFEDNKALCRWMFTGNNDFSAPFFDGTIGQCLRFPENTKRFKSSSSIEMLGQWSDEIKNGQPPAAIIFHVSRCGSTLAAQLLGLDDDNIVLSEVPFFDAVLREQKKFPEENADDIFKAAIAFYATKRNGKGKRFFIKTDSWHVFFYQQLRRVYPTTPFILLYRRPDEVMRSHQKRRGMQAVPGLIEPELFGLDPELTIQMNFDEYMATVLEKYFTAFINMVQQDKLAFAINYKEGAIAMTEKIAAVSNTVISGTHKELMKQRAGYHAKYPDQLFSEAALEMNVPGYLKKAFTLYDALENMRTTAAAVAQ